MPQAIKPNTYLLSDVQVDTPKDENTPRTFRGVANSGKPFTHWGRLSMVDLDGITFKEKMPVLHLHDRAERAAFGKVSVESHQLIISGVMLNNKYGSAIAEESDQGFPWQMSAHVEGTHTEELAHGETATVNGQEVTGPMDILRGVRVIEISFTPTGVDSETSALVMSDDATSSVKTQNPDKPNEDSPMTLEEALAKISQLEADNKAKQEKIDELEAQAKAKDKQSDVDAQLSQAGFKRAHAAEGWHGVSESTYNMLLSADADATKAVIADLSKSLQLSNDQGNQPANELPDYMLGEQHPPKAGDDSGAKLSDNPLIADAQARADTQSNYI